MTTEGGNTSFTKKGEMFWQFGKKEVKSSLKKKGEGAWLRLLKPLIRKAEAEDI